MEPPTRLSRRRLLQLGAGLGLPAVLAACAQVVPSLSASPRTSVIGTPAGSAVRTPAPTPTPVPTARPSRPIAAGRVLYRGAALADGRSATLQRPVSVLVEDGRIAWIRPTGGENDPGDARIVDASGATMVPGMIDGHSHVTGQGGAHWIERFADDPATLLEVAEANGRAAWDAGVRWLRDVGSPIGVDPQDGRQRALALGVRDRWAGRRDVPYLRAAGAWVMRRGSSAVSGAVEADNADELLGAALGQLDAGADLVKLYLDGPEPGVAPWSPTEVRRVVDAAHGREARVTAHAGHLDAARTAVAGGVDAIEHGFVLDAGVAAQMAAAGTMLVTTLTVFHSWISFAATTDLRLFVNGRAGHAERLERAEASVRLARDAGVAIAAGTDFGGGSPRAGQLAWEVEALVSAGLEPVEALSAATWRGGELLGEPDAGVIREGGPADFFFVHGDPLSDPAALWRIWRAEG